MRAAGFLVLLLILTLLFPVTCNLFPMFQPTLSLSVILSPASAGEGFLHFHLSSALGIRTVLSDPQYQ